MTAAGASVADAVAALRRGEAIGLPTETVYGLAADASDPAAVRRIFALKGRPADHPLIVHVADAAAIDDWARDVPPAARALAAAFWPGPLTMIVRRGARVADDVTGGQDTVGLRCPAHPLALQVLRAFGGGLSAPGPTSTRPITASSCACVIIPGRRTRGDAPDRSTIVLSMPTSLSPPSSTIGTASPNSSRTCAADVGLMRPKRLADGAASPPPKARSNASASGCAGQRSPTVS